MVTISTRVRVIVGNVASKLPDSREDREYVDWDSNPGFDLRLLESVVVLIFNELRTQITSLT